ncbi:MAG: hypothetical protein DDT39_00040 [Firmicutes bacterium]|nr:hypothetical protein [candidate division NPL-UPA2 bacterium]
MSAEGLRRRGMIGAEGRRSGYTFDDTVSGAPYEAESPYSTQLLAMATKNFAAGIDAAQGVAQKAMGFDDAAAANFREYDRLSGMARQRGPEIQSWDHVEQRGITAGNVGQYLTAQVAGMVPDAGLALAGMAAGTLLAPGVGTVGGLFAGSALRKTAQEAAKTAAESYAQREAARLAAAGVAADVAALSARAGATDVAKRAAAQTIAGDAATKALTGRIRAASMFAGATAAGIPSGLNDDRTVQLAREGDAGDATVLLGGGAAQAVLDTLPILRAVDQIGGQVTGEVLKKTTDRFLARAAKETAKMGALEGTTEVGQEVIKNASHAIVTENPELLYEPGALKNYLVSFFTGAVIGGGVGGGIETGGAAVRQTQRTARQAWEATNSYFRDKIRGPVQKDPGVAQNQAQADEVVAATRTPQDPSVLRGIRERSSYGVDNARKSAEINAQAEAATRSANEWRRSNRDFPLSLEVQRASGHGAEINLTMLSFVDGLPAFAQSLADTRPREQAADFLARTGSALYRSITAPHTLSADDQKMVAAVDPHITPARRAVMQALAIDWAARQAEVDAERSDREAEAAAVSAQPKAGTLGAIDGFEDMAAALRGQALVTQDYEGDIRDDRESPAPQETDADSRFAEMSPEDNVGAVDAYISALRAPTEGLDLESARVSAIAELEGPLKPGNRTPNNVISDAGNSAFFARRSQENGVLPYGEGRVWDAVGHARRLLAQNREVYAKADQPAKAALLDALSQAAAVGMPVDFGALRAGAYRMDRAGQELVRLTEAEVNAVQRSARFARPDSPTVPANPDSVVPFVDLGREQSAGYGYGPSDLAQRVRAAANETPIRLYGLPDGAVKRTTPRRDTTLDPPPSPGQDEADYRLGPGPLPAGAEARAVFPANRDPSAPVTPAPPVYDADGNVVEDGWLPASGGGYRSTATGEIITDINRFRAATLDARGTVPDMSPVRSVGFLGNRALTDETPETTAVKALGATIGADVDPRTGLPKITHPIASRYRYGAEPGTMLAVVRFLRGNKPTSAEVDVPETLIGWPARTPERAANPETEAPASARQIAATNRVRADFAPTVPDVVAHDADLTSPDAQAILHRMFNAKDGYAATLGVPIDGLPRDTRGTVDLVDELRGIVANGERPAARTAERFISELRGLADLAGPASVVARVFDTRYVQDAPAVARSASPYTAPDLEALGRRIAQRASDADLAAVKERAAQADVPYAVSRLSSEQADVVQKAAVAFVRPLGIPTLLTQFGGFLRRSGDTTVGATTYSVNGKHFVAIHTANMRKPDAVLDDEISSNRLKRTVTHEMAHVLARMHHDSTGALLSADPELAPGSEVWAQAEASVNANPVLSKTFGHVFNRAKTDVPAAQREMFAQLISLRNTHPRLLNAHIPAAATVLDTLLQVARDAAAGRASTRTSAAIEDAGSGAREAGGADGRDVPSGAGNQPQPRAAAGRGRQQDAVLASEGTMGPSAPVPAGAMETASVAPLSLPESGTLSTIARYSADPGAARREAELNDARGVIEAAETQAMNAVNAAAGRKFGAGVDALVDPRVYNNDEFAALYDRALAEYPGYAEAKTTINADNAAQATAYKETRNQAYAEKQKADAEANWRGTRPSDFRDDRPQYEKINAKVRREAFAMTEPQLRNAIERAQHRYEKTPAQAPGSRQIDPRSFIAMDLAAMKTIYRERFGGRLSADREADAQAAQTTAEQTAEQRTREGAYTEALLRGMGFPPASVTVASHTTEAGVVGAFEGAVTISPEGRITIVLGDALTGAERAEVLQHEIGHVALLQHIAKEAGVPLGALVGADGRMPTLNEVISALAEVSPELHAALKTDYDQWLSDNVDKAKGVNAVLASRGGLARAVGRQARGDAGPPLRDMDQAEVEALVSMEEWIADGVVRALNANRTATSIAGKFFSELARVLRAMYDRLTGGQQTPPSIESWVNGLFDAEATRLGGTVAEGRRKIIERASTFLHRAARLQKGGAK